MIAKHSVIIGTNRTSVSLESEFWKHIKRIAETRQCSVNDVVSDIDATRGDNNLSSACRLYVVRDLETDLARLRAGAPNG